MREGLRNAATIVPVPRQRNSREENEAVKAGETPEEWEKNPAKNRQKDKDARWTKKHGESFFGYKNRINADARHKLIRRYGVTNASVHDSRKFDRLVNKANTSADVYADSAYRSAEIEVKLRARGLRSRIHQRASRGHALSEAQEKANHQKSKVRARVEHVFGAQQTSPGGRTVLRLHKPKKWMPSFFGCCPFVATFEPPIAILRAPLGRGEATASQPGRKSSMAARGALC
jgi:transposase, IS5 family